MKELNVSTRYHWGNGLWNFIHTVSGLAVNGTNGSNSNTEYIKETNKNSIIVLRNIINVFPCPKCKEMYGNYLERFNVDSFDITDPLVLFYWSVDLHNAVNKKLNKPEWTYFQAQSVWFKW